MTLRELPWLQYLYGFLFYVIATLIFVILKMLGVFTFAWLWILSPLWIPLGLTTVALIGYFIYRGVEKIVWAVKATIFIGKLRR